MAAFSAKKRAKVLHFFYIRKFFSFFLHFFCVFRKKAVPLHPLFDGRAVDVAKLPSLRSCFSHYCLTDDNRTSYIVKS
jgi:hypothetical protein